jgi:ribonuclease HII
MVLAAVVLDADTADELVRAGVKDSKAFGSSAAGKKERARLAVLIRKHARWVGVEVCEVEEIDAYVARSGLNLLERERAERLICAAPTCASIVADGERLFSALGARFPQLLACNRAESAHPAVAAASICAKVVRDERFSAIALRYREEFGELCGGGYVNSATHAFVAEFVRRHGRLPPEARRSWPWRGIARSGEDSPPAGPLQLPQVR